MKESLWVVNPTVTAVSLNLTPKINEEELIVLSKHKAKRAIKAASINIRIDSQKKIDLVAASGLSPDAIRECADFKTFVRRGMIKVVWETHVVVIADVEIEEVIEESILIEDEPIEVELEEVEIIEEAPAPVLPSMGKKGKRGFSSFKRAKKE